MRQRVPTPSDDDNVDIQEKMDDYIRSMNKKIDSLKSELSSSVNKIETTQTQHRSQLNTSRIIISIIILLLSLCMGHLYFQLRNQSSSSVKIHFGDIIKLKQLKESCALNQNSELKIICSNSRDNRDYWIIESAVGTTKDLIKLNSIVRLKHSTSNSYITSEIGEKVTSTNSLDTSTHWRIISSDFRTGLVATGMALSFVNIKTNRYLYDENVRYERPKTGVSTIKADYRTDLSSMWKIFEIKNRFL
ncbi:hypothetical protein AKO1_008031, partial [Acrasis kona]